MKKTTAKKSQKGFMGKVVAPLIFILLIIGFVYWGSDESNQTSENPVAKGVAKFYAEVRQAIKPGEERINEYTIKLPENDSSLGQQLEKLDGSVQPASANWQGKKVKRSFEKDGTLKNTLQAHAKNEGVELIWDLKYDYVIKHHFTENSDMRSLIKKISTVVNNDYNGQVKTYFCKDANALVITDKDSEYVTKNCVDAK